MFSNFLTPYLQTLREKSLARSDWHTRFTYGEKTTEGRQEESRVESL